MLEAVKQNPTLPEAWQAAAELISYRSESAQDAPVPYAAIPVCHGPVDIPGADKGATASSLPGAKNQFTAQITGVGEKDCIANIDNSTISGWSCTHCIILYSGKPVSLRQVTFTNCLFVFNRPTAPLEPDAQKFSRDLLEASDLSKITINSTLG